jgi:signal peptidase I
VKKPLAKYGRMLTPGHALAAVGMLVIGYFLWGRVFEEGGTGSNVVLGLLVAIAVIYLGATNIGPILDDIITPKGRRARRSIREGTELDADVLALIKRARKGKEKKLDAKQADALAEVHKAFQQALSELEQPGGKAPTEAQLAHFDEKSAALHAALEKEMGTEKTSAAVVAQAKSLGIAFGIAIALRLFLVAPFQIPSGSMIPTLLIGDHLFVFRAMYGLQSPVGETPTYLVRWAMPKAGDVVVFEAPPWVPHNAGDDWIKRVIATAGQHVRRGALPGSSDDTIVFVDDKPLTQTGSGEPMRYMDFDEGSGGHGRWHEAVGAYHVEDDQGVLHDTFTDLPPATHAWPDQGEPRIDSKGLSCTNVDCTVKDGFVFVMGDNRDHSLDGRAWGAVPVDNLKGKALFIWVSVDGSEQSVHLGKFTLPRFRWDRLFRWIH